MKDELQHCYLILCGHDNTKICPHDGGCKELELNYGITCVEEA